MVPPGVGTVVGVAVTKTEPPTPPMLGRALSAACTCAAVALKLRALPDPVAGVFEPLKDRENEPVAPRIVTSTSEVLSKRGCQVRPPSMVFQAPPPAVDM